MTCRTGTAKICSIVSKNHITAGPTVNGIGIVTTVNEIGFGAAENLIVASITINLISTTVSINGISSIVAMDEIITLITVNGIISITIGICAVVFTTGCCRITMTVNGIIAPESVDGVIITATVNGIITILTIQGVTTGSTINNVGTFAAINPIIVSIAKQYVVTKNYPTVGINYFLIIKIDPAVVTKNDIISLTTFYGVNTAAAKEVVIAFTPINCVVSVIKLKEGSSVIFGDLTKVTKDDIITLSGINGIRTSTSIDLVISFTAGDRVNTVTTVYNSITSSVGI